MKHFNFIFIFLLVGFSVSKAQLTSISPTSGNLGENITITVNGSNITTAFDTVNFTSLYIGTFVDTTFIQYDLTNLAGTSGTQITGDLSIPSNATAGFYTVYYSRGGDSYTLPDAFTITEVVTGNPAEITSISPTSGNLGETVSIGINGSNITTAFDTVNPTSLYIGTFVDTTFIQYDLTNLSGTNGSQISGDLNIPNNAATGTYDLYYSRGSDSYTLPNAFTIMNDTSTATIDTFSISGILYEGAGKNSAEGDPVPNATLFLKDDNNTVVDQVVTNSLGEYSFESLIEGQYEVHYDNSNNSNPIVVTLNSTTPSPTVTLDIQVKSDGSIEEIDINNSISLINAYGLGIVNTIVESDLVFTFNKSDVNLEVAVYSLIGQKVVSKSFENTTTRNSINLSALSAGYYLITFGLENEMETFKIVKK